MSKELQPVDPALLTPTLREAIEEADRGEVVRLPREFLLDDYPRSTATDAEFIEDATTVLERDGVDPTVYLPEDGRLD